MTYNNYAAKKLETILIEDKVGCMADAISLALYPANESKRTHIFCSIMDASDDLDYCGTELENNLKRTVCALFMIMSQDDLKEVI